MRRPLVVALLACIALLLAAPAASAHAVLRSSDPASGASLGKAPEKVTLTFTEPPDLTLSSVHVLDSTGKAVERGKAQPVPGKPLALEVPLGQLPNGAYTVSWRTVSRTDGHLTNGSFAFGVGV
jgi:methionine-rich copper-binding protein CopC